MATEKYETTGINKVLDFENLEENPTLSTVFESEGPSMFHGEGFHCGEASNLDGTQSNIQSNPASQHQSEDEEVEETSLKEPKGKFRVPYT